MADNVVVSAGSGTTIAADEVVDGTLGTVKVQYVKIMDATLDGTTKAAVGANGLAVNVGNAVSAIKVGDGTNNAAIKAASTPPAATDASLVVAISPNSVNANGAATAANSAPTVAATNQQTISVAQDTSLLSNGVTGTNLTPKFQKITASSSGATTIVALVSAKKIRVLAWDLKVNAAVNFKWQSHVTPTDLTGLYYNSAQGDGVARAFNPLGYFETVAGEALDINLSGNVAVGGVLTYVEV